MSDRDTRDRLQRERAEGRFEIHIEARPDDDDWRPLRRAMRLSRADLEWLKQRVPGVVRRGAEVDLAPVVARIIDAGIRASLRRRGEAPERVNGEDPKETDDVKGQA